MWDSIQKKVKFYLTRNGKIELNYTMLTTFTACTAQCISVISLFFYNLVNIISRHKKRLPSNSFYLRYEIEFKVTREIGIWNIVKKNNGKILIYQMHNDECRECTLILYLECILASRTETSLYNQIPKYFAIKNREIVIAIFEAGNCCTSYNWHLTRNCKF